jgi:hypothetical protein
VRRVLGGAIIQALWGAGPLGRLILLTLFLIGVVMGGYMALTGARILIGAAPAPDDDGDAKARGLIFLAIGVLTVWAFGSGAIALIAQWRSGAPNLRL